MKPGIHLLLFRTLEILSSIAAGFLGFLIAHELGVRGGYLGLITFIAFILVVSLFRKLLTKKIPARCQECGGKTYFHGGNPITYHCSNCGFVHESSWGEGNIFPTKLLESKAKAKSHKQ